MKPNNIKEKEKEKEKKEDMQGSYKKRPYDFIDNTSASFW